MTKKLLLSLMIASWLCTGSVNAQTTLFSENFGSGTLPAGWSNDSLGMPALLLWQFNNPFARAITGAGFDANFAIFDSDQGGINDNVDELAALTTPNVDISLASGALYLEMDEHYRFLGGPNTAGSARRIEYSTDMGLTWTSMVYDSTGLGTQVAPFTGVHSMYDVSHLVGSAANLMFRFTWTGTWDWWWAIDNVVVNEYPITCTTPPVAGSTVAPFAVCSGVPFTLSLMGADSATGNTWMWESSLDNITWVPIAGGTSNTLTTTQAVATYYRCSISCNSQVASSVEAYVDLNPATLCYCAATHSVDCNGVNSAITNVTITGTTLNQSSGCDQLTAQAYTIWPLSPATSAELMRGNSYNISVTTDNSNITSVWIDYNQNGQFEASEWVQVSTTSTAGTASTVNILVPNSALVGVTMMRVRARLVGNQNDANSACITMGSGETEDFMVGIDVPVGQVELSNEGLLLYPNPVTESLSIFFGKTLSAATVTLFDQLGQVLQQHEGENIHSTRLEMASYSNGLYFVRIDSGNSTITKKVLLNR